jgi:hypothetical protein
MGSLYLLGAALEIIFLAGIGRGELEYLNFSGDIMGSLVMVVTGSLLAYGGYLTSKGMNRGLGFITVGILMGILLALVYLLVLISGYAVEYLSGEAEIGWEHLINGIVPEFYLAIPLLLPAQLLLRIAASLGKSVPPQGGGVT